MTRESALIAIVGYLLLSIPALISWKEKMKLEKDIFASGLRALIQLAILGSVLLYIFKMPSWIGPVVVSFFIFFGSMIASERGKNVPMAFPLALVAFTIGYLPAALVLFGTGVVKSIPNIFIPLSGMMIGNATKSVSLAYDRVHRMIERNQEVIEAAFIDGANYTTASSFFIHDLLRITLLPSIDSMKILGLVHIPGTMSGLLIAGTPPIKAAAYQAMIAYAIFSVTSLATMVATYGAFYLTLKSRYERIALGNRFREGRRQVAGG